jgi:ATP-dependent exoDNAse (exonuclease V) alpha subunit
MLKDSVQAMTAFSGKGVLVFAPSSAATQVLKEQGFNASDTVQCLMTNTIVQDAARGKMLLVDEAGFLSAKQMRWLVNFAGENQCRLVLCGDSRQHHAVERGDSLRVLEKTGAVEPAALTKIFRQRIPALRDAIQELSRGETEKGFDKLDKFDVIQEIEGENRRLSAIAERHVQAIKEKKTSLIVAPTHGECREIAKSVRQALKSGSLLSTEEGTFCRLEKLNLTGSSRLRSW